MPPASSWSPKETSTAEYLDVKDRTEKYVQPQHGILPVVIIIEKITSPRLQMKFLEAHRNLLNSTFPSRLLFHGTSNENIQSITQNGFRLPPVDEKKMFGQVDVCLCRATNSSKIAQERSPLGQILHVNSSSFPHYDGGNGGVNNKQKAGIAVRASERRITKGNGGKGKRSRRNAGIPGHRRGCDREDHRRGFQSRRARWSCSEAWESLREWSVSRWRTANARVSR